MGRRKEREGAVCVIGVRGIDAPVALYKSPILFHSILFYSILFYYILFYIPFLSVLAVEFAEYFIRQAVPRSGTRFTVR